MSLEATTSRDLDLDVIAAARLWARGDTGASRTVLLAAVERRLEQRVREVAASLPRVEPAPVPTWTTEPYTPEQYFRLLTETPPSLRGRR